MMKLKPACFWEESNQQNQTNNLANRMKIHRKRGNKIIG